MQHSNPSQAVGKLEPGSCPAARSTESRTSLGSCLTCIEMTLVAQRPTYSSEGLAGPSCTGLLQPAAGELAPLHPTSAPRLRGLGCSVILRASSVRVLKLELRLLRALLLALLAALLLALEEPAAAGCSLLPPAELLCRHMSPCGCSCHSPSHLRAALAGAGCCCAAAALSTAACSAPGCSSCAAGRQRQVGRLCVPPCVSSECWMLLLELLCTSLLLDRPAPAASRASGSLATLLPAGVAAAPFQPADKTQRCSGAFACP